MPSVVVTATNVVPAPPGAPGALVAPAIRNAKRKPTSMTINNTGSVADHSIEVWDSFTPDISNAVAIPVFTTVRRHRFNILAGDAIVLEEEDLKNVECLGALSILADAVDAACFITVGYENQ